MPLIWRHEHGGEEARRLVACLLPEGFDSLGQRRGAVRQLALDVDLLQSASHAGNRCRELLRIRILVLPGMARVVQRLVQLSDCIAEALIVTAV